MAEFAFTKVLMLLIIFIAERGERKPMAIDSKTQMVAIATNLKTVRAVFALALKITSMVLQDATKYRAYHFDLVVKRKLKCFGLSYFWEQ
jgi:hypothetical protein